MYRLSCALLATSLLLQVFALPLEEINERNKRDADPLLHYSKVKVKVYERDGGERKKIIYKYRGPGVLSAGVIAGRGAPAGSFAGSFGFSSAFGSSAGASAAASASAASSVA